VEKDTGHEIEYLLNKPQAVCLACMCHTPVCRKIRRALIKIWEGYDAGTLVPMNSQVADVIKADTATLAAFIVKMRQFVSDNSQEPVPIDANVAAGATVGMGLLRSLPKEKADLVEMLVHEETPLGSDLRFGLVKLLQHYESGNLTSTDAETAVALMEITEVLTQFMQSPGIHPGSAG